MSVLLLDSSVDCIEAILSNFLESIYNICDMIPIQSMEKRLRFRFLNPDLSGLSLRFCKGYFLQFRITSEQGYVSLAELKTK